MEKDYSSYFNKPNLRAAAKRSKSPVEIHREGLEIPQDLPSMIRQKTYLVRTFGCQANERDGETIAGILESIGYQEAESVETADLIILNTCAVRENAEDRVFGIIGNIKQLKQHNPDLLFGICGCMAQEESMVEKILTKYPYVDLIFGTHNIHNLPRYLFSAYLNKEKVVEVFSVEGDVVENLPVKRQGSLKAWVNIMYGCDKFCTYCIVPYTRGKERSRLPQDIMEEVHSLIDQGYQEIALLGQNVNAYGKDLKDPSISFSSLLEEVAKTNIPRIRFMTSHPWDFTDAMIDVIASYPNIMPAIHLPFQAGDDEILRRMGRRYTSSDYLRLYHKLRERIKGCSITTDIIVGFPGESEEQFQHTLDLVNTCQFDSAFTFLYSPREGTPAAKMVDDVPLSVKKERFLRLTKQIAEHANKRNQPYLHQTIRVLVEGTSKRKSSILSGYSETNKLVNFEGDQSLIGSIVSVKITKVKTWTLEGEVVHE